MKILIGSPIKQKSNILEQFLISLEELDLDGVIVDYYFVDDNIDIESSELLKKFKKNHKRVLLKSSIELVSNNKEYECNNNTHLWKKDLIDRIITFKNDIIKYAKENDYDYLFLVDSDIVLNPSTIKHLMSRNVDIVSNVFWTSWSKGKPLLPQVWLQDENNCYYNDWDFPLSENDKRQKTKNFVNMLKTPGIYKVGGLGACTLINKKSIIAGISFSLIDNVSFWGEDRHFCIRARVLGIEMYVDTIYPAYHIYREEYLCGVKDYKKNGFNPNQYIDNPMDSNRVRILLKKKISLINKVNFRDIYKRIKSSLFSKKRVINEKNHLTVSMIVHNEEKRYLESVLTEARKYADRFVIIDDASTDNTVELCKKLLKNKELKLIVNKKSMFSKEHKLRRKQWIETIKTNPDWILFLDADEIFENKFMKSINYLMANKDIDLYSFRVYDMWNKNEYREDELWQNKLYHRFLLRYQPKFKYKFLKTNQHCGRMPANVVNLSFVESDIRVKHYGWANEDDRRKKYERYMELDPDGKTGSIEQYMSILDEKPNLKKFIEED